MKILEKLLASFVFLTLVTSTALAGGSSLSFSYSTESMLFEPGAEGQNLINFDLTPSVGDDITLENFLIECGPHDVFEGAEFSANEDYIDIEEFEKNNVTGMYQASFSPGYLLEDDNSFQIAVDLKEDLDSLVVVCRYSMQFYHSGLEELVDGKSITYGYFEDDLYPIFIIPEKSENVSSDIEVWQDGLGSIDVEHNSSNNLIAEFGIETEEDLELQDVFVICSNSAFESFELKTPDGRSIQKGTHDIDYDYQSALFSDLDVSIKSNLENDFQLLGDSGGAGIPSYHHDSVCVVNALNVNFATLDEAVDLSSIRGVGFSNAPDTSIHYYSKWTEGFEDVPYSHPNFEAIDYLQRYGFVDGYNDGTYKPGNDINRAEFAKMLVDASWVAGQGWSGGYLSGENCFSDVGEDDWYVGYVCAAKSKKWVSGHPDGSFRPADTINLAETVKMVLEMLDIDTTPDPQNEWYEPYFKKYYELVPYKQFDMDLDAKMTRGDVAEILHEIILAVD